VTVTAEATPIELVKTPNPVIVLDKAELEKWNASNLGDLLQAVLPGQVVFTGGAGSVSSLSLGGARVQDTVVTLDGIRLTDAAGLGGVDLSLISLAGIERVEIQQGPCSTRFGSDAQAGVVALYSAGHAQDGLSGQVMVGIGNQDIHEAGFGAAYGWGSGWVRASVSAQREEGSLPADNDYRTTGTYVGVGQQLGQDTLLTVNYMNTFSGVPLPIVYVSASPRDPSQYDAARQDFSRLEVVGATLRSTLTSTLTGELSLGQALQVRLEPDYTTNLPADRYLSRRNQAGGSLTWKPCSDNTLQGGFEAYEETAFSFGTLVPAEGRHVAVFLEDQWEVTRDIRLVGSLRQERDRLTYPTATGSGEDDVSQTTGKFGFNWILGGGWRFFASAGNAFANPLLFQTIYNAEYQGSTLDNERSTTYQTGVSFEQGPWRAGLTLSRTLYRDLIYYNPDGGEYIPDYGGYYTGIYQNGSDLRLQSAQVDLGYQTDLWSLKGFCRNQDFRDEEAPAGQQYLNDAVLRKPFNSFGISGHRTFGPVRIEARWSWTGPRYDYGVPNPAYNSAAAFDQHYNDLSLAVAWAVRHDLLVTLRGDNLMQPKTSVDQWLAGTRDFQNDASQAYGYPAQPATVKLELRYRF
jgi:vitamin B12 transporter